jgi:hypothetical protein
MTYVLAALAALICAVGGFSIAATVGGAIAPLIGISSFEGAAGYLAVFVLGPIGGLIGLVLGLWLVLRYHGGYHGFAAIVKRGALVVGVLAILAGGGVLLRLATLENFPSGEQPQMDFEIRLPASAAVPGRQGLDFEMQAGSQRSGGLLRDEWLRRDGERAVLVGFVPLYTRTSQRMLVVSRPGEPKLIFQIRLSATPTASNRYGDWQRVDFIDDMKPDSMPRRPESSETFEIRYKVLDWRQR